ncbi:MAG TPA: F0F1 ATP synthase subunit alpha [Euzebyales bacterium]|nr:F0F1 ATP synthase subunit alpha [Euzebyales bacterium]
MTDLSISTDDITRALRSQISDFSTSLQREQVGYVTESGDGIARVAGLPSAMANELLELGTDHEGQALYGIALNLEEDSIGVVILGDGSVVEEGQEVKATGDVLSVPVGDAYLGRVVDPLGRPIDGKGPLDPDKLDGRRGLEVQAPSVVERQPVKEPLQTGIKAIDAMIPIGRGQRELIIGDRQVGKTAVAIDTIINQRGLWGSDRQVKCIYVAIGQKGSTVAEIVARLEANGALDYTTIVNASASSAAPFQYIAPYAGCAIGSYWMYNGEHALIVYDDLSKQADAYRQLSLLLRRPPGREAYPGDVFYLHSRLLERSAKLSDDLGGGSLTGLPIIETKGGDVSAFIPTNVISITDGQIYLETDLFFQGVRPAINAGISVSRVGGDAQIKAMKEVSGTMRLDLAQYRDLEAFASFGSELDQASQNQLDRGERTVEVLKQPQYAPVPVEEQVIVVWAVTNGRLDDVPVEDVQAFNERLREHVRSRHADLLEHLGTEGTLGDDVAEQIADAVDGFKRSFSSDDDEDLDIDHGADEDLAELGDDVERAHGEAQDDPATGTSDAEVGRGEDDDDVVDEEEEATDAFEYDDATGEAGDTSDDDATDEITADGDDDNR